MGAIMITIGIAVVSLMLLNSIIRSKRSILCLKIEEAYGKMEFATAKSGITLENNVLEYLKCYKNYTVNPELLDITILCALIINKPEEEIKRASEKFKQLESNIPSELKVYGQEIDSYCFELIKLSRWKPDSIRLFARIIFEKFKENSNSKIKELINPDKECAITLSEFNMNDLKTA